MERVEEGVLMLLRQVGPPSLVEVRGPLDAATIERLVDVLEHTPGDVLVDLDAVTFLDSVALGRLTSAVLAAADRGVTIAVVRASELVRRVAAYDPDAAARLGLVDRPTGGP